MEIHFFEQLNANRTYFYPANKAAEALIELMQRKALVEADIPKLKALIKSWGLKASIKVVANERGL